MPFKFDNFNYAPKIIPDATPSNDGVMTKAQAAQSGATGGAQPYTNTYGSAPPAITRYVRLTGSDSTGDGLTPGTAWKTTQHALDSTPVPLGSRLVINGTGYGIEVLSAAICLPAVLGGPIFHDPYFDQYFPPYPPPSQEYLDFGYYYQSDVEFYAAPTTLLSIPSGSWSVTADAVTRQATFNVPGAAWAVNQWQNKLVRWNTGGSIGRIISNTATQLVTNIVYTGGTYAIPLDIVQESWTWDATAVIGSAFASGRACAYGVTVAGINLTGGSATFFSSNLDITSLVVLGCSGIPGNPSCQQFYSIGNRWYDAAGANTNYMNVHARLVAWSIGDRVDNPSVYANQGVGSSIYNGLYKTGGDSIGEGYYHQGAAGQPQGIVQVINTEARDTGRGGRRLLNNQMGEVGYCRLTNCGYGGIRMEMQSLLKITGPVDGTGNGANVGGAGMYSLDQSTIEFNWGAGLNDTNFTLHGTIGDMQCGNNPLRSNTDFFTGVPLASEYDERCGARIYERPGAVEALTLALPTPDVTWRGMVKVLQGGGGVADKTYVCLKAAAGTYSWVLIATG